MSNDFASTLATWPAARVNQPAVASSSRYSLMEEIARGGMGVVYRAVDDVLRRKVAVKVLHERIPLDSGVARRFNDEARITAQLQHPGIPAVHDLGTLPDGRPFLVMKLILGQTLHDQLADRPYLLAERGRFIAAFEQLCQAVAFAHAHHVIHRDLKPMNVMLGAFGEVQVMDWGLAKILNAPSDDAPQTISQSTMPLRDEDTHTQAGSVLGTPAFMPPEQAAGEIERVDQRSDVFGLGSILAVILTGEPAYTGGGLQHLLERATQADLGDCFARLDSCGADSTLVALCKRCLAARPEDRPADAGEVAQAVAEWRRHSEERARQADLHQLRRRWQIASAIGIGVILALAVLLGWWLDRQESSRVANARQQQATAHAAARRRVDLAILSAAEQMDDYQFLEASRTLERAADQLAQEDSADLRAVLDTARSDLALVRQLDNIRFNSIRLHPGSGSQPMTTAYRAAFARRGVDPASGTMAALDWVRLSPVKRFVVIALDNWARHERDPAVRESLVTLARGVDPSPFSNRLRDPAHWKTRADRDRLALTLDLDQLPANLLVLYFQIREEPWPGAAAAFAKAATRFPNDFWIQYEAAHHHAVKEPNPAEAIIYLRSALAIRPDHVYAYFLLGRNLASLGRHVEAVDALRRALALDPTCDEARTLLGEIEAAGSAKK